ADMLALVKNLPASGKRLSILPNSNYPAQTGFGLRYSNNASYFAAKMLEISSLGVYAVGGCCGTTPEHILQVTSRIKGERETYKSASDERREQPVQNVRHSKLRSALESEKKLVAVELSPPENTDMAFVTESAAAVKRAGADLVTLPDSPLARPRADSFMTAARVMREVGIETLPHLACRDKNRIAIQGQLIGANAERVQNVLVVTGDSISKNNPADAVNDKNVFNFNSFSLISYINSLNDNLFAATPFHIAAALNVNAANFDIELERALQKEERGAALFLTQALFTDESVDCLRRAREVLRGKILAGILPIAGYKNAVFLNNEVSGMSIPQKLVDSLKDKSPEETKSISLDFCRSIIDRTGAFCDGYYIMTPRKKIDFVIELITYIKAAQL
ncbi:MAG TPA: methylenetetrahydrofolate reductase, partial [Clostridia bacterium]|nr:methylenetetrahydrofolate reductase [Clostridia bacterium]